MENKASNFGKSEFEQSKLALQFMDLLDHIDSTRTGILERLRQVQDDESKIGVLQNQVQVKAEELHAIERLIEEKLKEVELGKDHLRSLELSIKKHDEEISVKEKRRLDVERWVGEKEREYRSIEKLVESKEKELEEVQRVLNKYSVDIELKERKLIEIRGSIEVQKKESALKEELIKAAQRSVDECDKEVKLKEEKLCLIRKSIVECSKTIESKEKVIREMDLKVKDFCLHKKSMEEWSSKLELKENHFESKVEELSLIEKRVNECLNEMRLKEKHLGSLENLIQECGKHFDSQEKLLQECSNTLELKERQIQQQAKELELNLQQFDLIQKSIGEHTHNQCTPATVVTIPSSARNQSNINSDGRGLQLLMNEHLKRIDLLSSEMSARLQVSPDPAKLVLDAMQGFYPSKSPVDSIDLTVIRRSCVLLLMELNRLSPHISPQVREEAIKLADDWKAKMTVVAENSSEVLGLLWLLTAFELGSTYDRRELQGLLAIVSQWEHATELRQALGIRNSASGSTLSFPVKIEESEPSPVRNRATSPPPNLQPSATTDSRNLQGCLDEQSSGSNSFQNSMFDALRLSFDPEKFVLKLMQKSLDQYWREGDVGFEAKLVKIHIPLLKELMKISPHVGPDVKKDAVSLAIQWKQIMGASTEKSLEVFGFLHFIAAYGLFSVLSGDEIVRLLGMVCQNKQALELCQTLGFADKIPDFIQNLIERKQLIDAVKLICTFKLFDKLPPALLLNEYAENIRQSYRTSWQEKKSFDEKDEVVDNHIADLRAMIQCIKDNNLESEFPSNDIEIQIVKLEQLKQNCRRLVGSSAFKFEQEGAKRKGRNTGASAPKFQQPEKRQAIGAAGHYTLPSFTYGYPHFSSSSQAIAAVRSYALPANINRGYHLPLSLSSQVNENYPGQFGVVANDRDAGVNFDAMHLSSSSGLYENYRHLA